MSPEKHYAYSVQWFLIAVACVVVAIFASRKRIDNEK
jgi:cytochrome oxidase assembly protein ShyY1